MENHVKYLLTILKKQRQQEEVNKGLVQQMKNLNIELPRLEKIINIQVAKKIFEAKGELYNYDINKDDLVNLNNKQKRKVPTEVNYSKNMPDIKNLMEVWPDKEEQAYKKVEYPNEKMNISLENYTKIACNMMDIPIHPSDGKQSKSLIESLHCLFTLYSGFKDNIHLQNKEDSKTK